MKAGIALKGTAYAFTDPRFSDLFFQDDRILLINPLTGTGYVAMSGICTHEGCSPEYFAKCIHSDSDNVCTAPEGGTGDVDAGGDAGTMLLTDVLWCPCHQSVFDAKTGVATMGPAVASGNLQVMKTCVGGGYVFVFIPDNGSDGGSGGGSPTP